MFEGLPYYTGEKLKERITNLSTMRKAYIENFLYEQSVLMLAGDPGVGKSSLALQISVQLASGVSVFGGLVVQQPRKVYYLMGERPVEEACERLRAMSQVFEICYDNLLLDPSCQGINLLKPDNAQWLFERIKGSRFALDVLVMDPCYTFVAGGLASDIQASAFVRFSASIQAFFSCSLILVHHNNRGSRNESGTRVGGDVYGNQWLIAHPSGIYSISKTQDGTHFEVRKDNYGNLIKGFSLEFDPESFLSSIPENDSNMQGKDRVSAFLNKCKIDGTVFTIKEMMAKTQLSHAYLHGLISEALSNGTVQMVKSWKNKRFYKCLQNGL